MKQLMYHTVELNDAATTDEDRYLTPCHPDGGEWRLVSAILDIDTAATAEDGEQRTVTLKNGATSLGSLDTFDTAWVEGTAQAFALSGGLAREFTANVDALTVVSDHTGSTGRVAVGRVGLTFERV